jgi:EAL domain-containing protein (putative c-di-GMP-specific phosphodiesterase class I)
MNALEGRLDIAQSRYRGHQLSSHFQPIIAVAHMRAAGAEALLRAEDLNAQSVTPHDMFLKAGMFGESVALDQAAHETHLTNFQEFKNESRWLFLNTRPEMLTQDASGRSLLESMVARFGYRPSQIVISIAEHADFANEHLLEAMAAHQSKGFLIAIDNFGIGSSNFDRILGVRPDFVKLNRSLVHRSSLSRNDRRVVKMLVSMLHRMGAMVVAESVETAEEALAVMDCDVDMMQGYYFGRPTKDLRSAIFGGEDLIRTLWPRLSDLSHRVTSEEAAQISAVRSMVKLAIRVLEAGGRIEEAAQRFFAAPNTLSCFIVDAKGIQKSAVSAPAVTGQSAVLLRTTPLFFYSSANWSRRTYFKDATAKPGQIAIHGPHRSITDGAFVYTVARTFEIDGETMVFCGNFRLDQQDIPIDCID